MALDGVLAAGPLTPLLEGIFEDRALGVRFSLLIAMIGFNGVSGGE